MDNAQKIKIAISVPVHKSPECIVDQLLNIHQFLHDPVIIYHLSASFNWSSEYINERDLLPFLKGFSNVYINPKRHESERFYNIHLIHISNFLYLYENHVAFDYFCMHSSRDYFIKKGLEKYVKPYDCGISWKSEQEKKHWYFPVAQKDTALHRILNKSKINNMIGGQVEGSFYRRDIFKKVSNQIESEIDADEMDRLKYQREEIWFPTIAQAHCDMKQNCAKNYVYVDWEKEQIITRNDIKQLERNNDVFAVKKVPLNINSHVRKYMRGKSPQCISCINSVMIKKPDLYNPVRAFIYDIYLISYKYIFLSLKLRCRSLLKKLKRVKLKSA